MYTTTYKIPLSYTQIRTLISQLSFKDKIRLGKELASETIDRKLTRLLDSFRTDELSEEIINQETEIVRKELYAKRQKNKNSH